MIKLSELDEMRKRAERASAGPWEVLGGGKDVLSNSFSDGTFSREDAAFIASAREDVPRLINEVLLLRKQVKDLRFCIKALNTPDDSTHCDEAGEVRINKPNGESISYRVYDWFNNISALIEAFSVETHPTIKFTRTDTKVDDSEA